MTTTTAAPSTTAHNTIAPSRLLRFLFTADGAGCVGMGVAMIPLTGWLESTLGLPAALLYALAAYLIGYGAFELYVGTRPRPLRSSVIAVVALNAVWVLDSAITLAAGWFSPTTAGTWTIALLGAGVAGVTALQAYAYKISS